MVTIDGIPVLLQKNSLNISDAIEERSTCSFVVVDIEGNLHYKQGQHVEATGESGVIFSGLIDIAKEKRFAAGDKLHAIQCKDWHYLADKLIIAKAYENTKSGDVVRDIVAEKLADEGVITFIPADSQTWILYHDYTWQELHDKGGNP